MSPKVVRRTETPVSAWVRLVEKEIEFEPGASPELYHCFAQSDYVVVLARTPDGLIPIVQQYRPAVDGHTWELPAGLLEADEDPATCCRRELKEEVGLEALTVRDLGSYFPDTGRLENRIHVFFALTCSPDPGFTPEPGMTVQFVDEAALHDQVLSGLFRNQLHIAVLTIARLKGAI